MKTWEFKGVLVSFKLERGMQNEELINVAVKSLIHSGANMVVANAGEWSEKGAFIVTINMVTKQENSIPVRRDYLPEVLWRKIRRMSRRRNRG